LRCATGEATMNLARGKASFGLAPGQACTP
jgi:hypothetical protein